MTQNFNLVRELTSLSVILFLFDSFFWRSLECHWSICVLLMKETFFILFLSSLAFLSVKTEESPSEAFQIVRFHFEGSSTDLKVSSRWFCNHWSCLDHVSKAVFENLLFFASIFNLIGSIAYLCQNFRMIFWSESTLSLTLIIFTEQVLALFKSVSKHCLIKKFWREVCPVERWIISHLLVL